jgi:predicted phage tail protein
VETILLRRLEAFRRMLLVVLLGAFFVLQLVGWWSPLVIQWIRGLASAVVGTAMDQQGEYLLLRGVQRLLSASALLEEIRTRPPPLEHFPPH